MSLESPARTKLVQLVQRCGTHGNDVRHALPAWVQAINLAERPVLLLGASTEWARAFLAQSSGRASVVALVDDYRAGERIQGYPVINAAGCAALAAGSPGMVAVNMTESSGGTPYFEHLCRTIDLPCLSLLQSFRIAGMRLPNGGGAQVQDAGQAILESMPEADGAAHAFADDLSRETLWRVLLFRLTGERTHLEQIALALADPYFAPGLLSAPERDSVLVDGGAYNGDSFAAFREWTNDKFRSAHLFEPDPSNCAVLRQAATGDTRIHVYEAALGAKRGTLSFSPGLGLGSHATQHGEIAVTQRSMDEAIDERITVIKLDVEGSEAQSLLGGEGHLLEDQPQAAVCVYHRPHDIWSILAYLREKLPRHRFYLRHHGAYLWDTILYAARD